METKTNLESSQDTLMSVSRSGRVRKKSSKLLDFQSPDEVEKKLKRISRPTRTNQGGGRVGRPSNVQRISGRTSNSISSNFDEDEHDNSEDDMEEIDDFGGTADSDDEIDELVADIVEEVEAEAVDHGDNPAESKVRQSLYMSEKSNKRKILKDGKIITSKLERKDKGKSRYTAYSLWAREFRKSSKFSKTQDLDFPNASRRLGELWANVSNKEKSAWRRKAKIQATKAKAREKVAPSTNLSPSASTSFVNRATTSRTKKLAEQQKATPPPSPSSPKRKRYSSLRSSTAAGPSTSSAAAAASEGLRKTQNGASFLNSNYLSTANNSTVATPHKTQLPNIEPIDAAAHLKLLGESLSIIGERLKEHEGQIALSGSLSVLLDSILCSLGPLMCLTAYIPGLEKKSQLTTNLATTLDNIAYVMPGL